MKKLGKEDIITITNINGVEKHRIKKCKTVYLLKGKEVVHYVTWYRTINRDENGRAFLIVNTKMGKPTSLDKILGRFLSSPTKKLDE